MKYKAFISYSSSEDSLLSSALQRKLESFTKKWYQAKQIRIFRDYTSLRASHSLWSSIEQALNESEYFIYLASPLASKSPWVQKEIQWWLDNRSIEKMLIVLTDGVIEWDSKDQKFNTKSSTAIPRILVSTFTDEPLHVDVTWSKQGQVILPSDDPRLHDSVATIASVLINRDKDELISYNLKEANKRKRAIQTVISSLSALLVGLVIALNHAFKQTALAEEQTALAQQQTIVAEKSTAEAVENAKEAKEKELESKYNLAKVFEDRSLSSLRQVKNQLDDSIRVEESRKSVLYALEALKQTIPKDAKVMSDESAYKLSNVKKEDLFPKLHQTKVHSYDTAGLSISRNGKYMASISNAKKGSVKIWDLKSGKVLWVLRDDAVSISDLAFSKDNEKLLIGKADNSVSVWSIPLQKKLYNTILQKGDFKYFRIGKKGEVHVVATERPPYNKGAIENYGIFLYKIDLINLNIKEAFENFFTVKADQYFVFSVNDNATKIAFTIDNRKVEIFNISEKQVQYVVNGNKLDVTNVEFSNKENEVILRDSESLKVWNYKKNELINTLEFKNINRVSFNEDGSKIAYSDERNRIHLYDFHSGSYINSYYGHRDFVTSLKFVPGGKLLVSDSIGGSSIKIWDIESGKILNSGEEGFNNKTGWIKFLKSTNLLAFGVSNKIKIWDTSRNKIIRTLDKHRWLVADLIYSSRLKAVASSSASGMIKVWNPEDWSIIHELDGHKDLVHALDFSPNKDILASGSHDGSLKLWNIKSGQELQSRDIGEIHSIAYSLDGQFIAVALTSEKIYVVRSKNLKTYKIIEGDWQKVEKVVFSPKGDLLAAYVRSSFIGNIVGDIKLWDLNTNTELVFPQAYPEAEGDIEFSKDGSFFVTSSKDSRIVFWETDTRKPLKVLNGHLEKVENLDLSADGETLVSSSKDTSFAFWDTKIGHHTDRFNGHSLPITDFDVAIDSQKIVSVSEDRTVKLWNVRTGISEKIIDLVDKEESNESFINTSSLNQFNAVDFSPDGSIIACSTNDKVYIYNIATKSILEIIDLSGVIKDSSLTFSSNGKYLAVVHASTDDSDINSISFLNTTNWNLESIFQFPTEASNLGPIDMRFIESTDTLISLDYYGKLYFTDLKKGFFISKLSEFKDKIDKFDISSNGKFLAAIVDKDPMSEIAGASVNPRKLDIDEEIQFYNRDLYIFDIQSGEIIKELSNVNQKSISLAFSPSGDNVAVGSVDSSVRVTNILSGKTLSVNDDISGIPMGVKYMPDGNSLVVLTGDPENNSTSLNLVNIESTEAIRRLIFDFDPLVVSDALKYLWGLEFDGFNFNPSSDNSNLYPQHLLKQLDSSDSADLYHGLMRMPSKNKTKLDQLISWLEKIPSAN